MVRFRITVTSAQRIDNRLAGQGLEFRAAGRWAGDNTLVVRTTGMSFRYYNPGGLPQSPQAEIIERLVPDQEVHP